MPAPQARLGSLTKDVASKEEIIANKGLLVKACNVTEMMNVVISTYTLRIKSSNKKEGDEILTIKGNLLSEKAIAVIKTLAPDDVITFDDIKAVGGNFYPKVLHRFSITIK